MNKLVLISRNMEVKSTGTCISATENVDLYVQPFDVESVNFSKYFAELEALQVSSA